MLLIKSLGQLFGLARLGLFIWLTWETPNHWWWVVAFCVCNFVSASVIEYRMNEAKEGRPS